VGHLSAMYENASTNKELIFNLTLQWAMFSSSTYVRVMLMQWIWAWNHWSLDLCEDTKRFSFILRVRLRDH
jgi:hypothetical protein